MIAPKKICFVAGASGGHIVPALTLAREILSKSPTTTISFFSTTGMLDQAILGNCHELEHLVLNLNPLPKRVWYWPWWVAQALWVVLRTFWWFQRNRPERLVSMGGLISVPVCYAAWWTRIPIDLYELNAVPGKAVTFLAPYADNIFITMPQANSGLQKYNCHYVSYPVRYTNTDKRDTRQARLQLGLEPDIFTLMIVGGSQGSQFINKLMQQFFDRHLSSYTLPIQVIHQTGERDQESTQQWYRQRNIPAIVFAYRPDIVMCYNAADYVIARGGAGTLFELQFFEKPSLIIPLETTTNDHQLSNAYAMAQLVPTLFTVVRQLDLQQDSKLLDAHIYAVGQLAGLPPKTA